MMYAIAAFDHSVKVEMALTSIEKNGIPKQNILAVPLDTRAPAPMLFDRMHSSDSRSLLDVPMILAALFALFGLIYGFLLVWGPVLWALIGTGVGFFIGLAFKFLVQKKRNTKAEKAAPAVMVMVCCADTQLQMVQDTLWAHSALAVAKLNLGTGA
jgi:hypothetical protein